MKTLLVIGGIGLGLGIAYLAWNHYKKQLALIAVMSDPKGVAKMGIDAAVDYKVNQGLNAGIDFLAGKIGL